MKKLLLWGGLVLLLMILGVGLIQSQQGQVGRGEIAPDFELISFSGETYQLSDYRGSVIVVNFWASWCESCKPEAVDLEAAHMHRYPHEFSGGQRQRIGIARALAVEPELIICDEPTSALDVSVRTQVLALLTKLQEESGVSYLFITHDLSIVPMIADEVAVMKEGKIVEQGSVEDVMENPQHPYTQKLLASAPKLMNKE